MSESTLTYETPDGFHPMTGEELRKVYTDSNPDREGIWNKDSHTMITVLRKDYPLLLTRLADLKAVCRRNEQKARKGYAGHGYQCTGFFSADVAGQPAEGYSFCYSIGDVRQSAETVLLKRKQTVFSITCVGRADRRMENHRVFTDVLESVR